MGDVQCVVLVSLFQGSNYETDRCSKNGICKENNASRYRFLSDGYFERNRVSNIFELDHLVCIKIRAIIAVIEISLFLFLPNKRTCYLETLQVNYTQVLLVV